MPAGIAIAEDEYEKAFENFRNETKENEEEGVAGSKPFENPEGAVVEFHSASRQEDPISEIINLSQIALVSPFRYGDIIVGTGTVERGS